MKTQSFASESFRAVVTRLSSVVAFVTALSHYITFMIESKSLNSQINFKRFIYPSPYHLQLEKELTSPLSVATLGKVGFAPHLGSTAELILLSRQG